MRIIAGTHRGKKLITLEGEQVRPTTDRVKESLFNILQFQLEGRRFLDLFAGSGQIGLEALSRAPPWRCLWTLPRSLSGWWRRICKPPACRSGPGW